MSKQSIGIGSAPDDGTGDQIRTAFNKTNLNFTEIYGGTNPDIAPQNTLGALAIDTTKRLNYKSISADSTFTFSGAPDVGTWFSLQVHNSDTDFDKKITFPSSYSIAKRRATTTAVAVHAGDVIITWYYNGSTYFVMGDTPESDMAVGQYTYLAGINAGLSATLADSSVFIGYNAGWQQNYSPNGQAVAIGYAAGSNPGGYAGTFVGYFAGAAGGGTSAVGIGYGAMSGSGQGTGNIAIGVHAAEATSTISGTIAMGYHVLNAAGGSSAQNSVIIGDHAASSSGIAADNCIFLGPFSGVSRNNTLWIDGTGTSFNGLKPLIYGEFDNRKFTINGAGLFDTAAASSTADASSALEVRSTSKGFLLPRMTKTQRNAISSPVAGLAVYQTDNTPGLRVYNGTNWMKYTEATD